MNHFNIVAAPSDLESRSYRTKYRDMMEAAMALEPDKCVSFPLNGTKEESARSALSRAARIRGFKSHIHVRDGVVYFKVVKLI